MGEKQMVHALPQQQHGCKEPAVDWQYFLAGKSACAQSNQSIEQRLKLLDRE